MDDIGQGLSRVVNVGKYTPQAIAFQGESLSIFPAQGDAWAYRIGAQGGNAPGKSPIMGIRRGDVVVVRL